MDVVTDMKIPLYTLKGPEVPMIPDKSMSREHYRNNYMGKPVPIVIDNGSFQCRAGWAGENMPTLRVRSVVARPKAKKEGEQSLFVGSEITDSDVNRLNIRSPFERDIVYHIDSEEMLLDYVFSNLGLSADNIPHPIVMTEAVCNPNYCRKIVSELLFECYDVPSVCYGIDSLFSLSYNAAQWGNWDGNAFVVSSGHSTTHVLPVLQNRVQLQSAKRIAVGGHHSLELMAKVMQLKYPQHRQHITVSAVQELTEQHTEVSIDYREDLNRCQQTLQNKERPESMHVIQLPWTPAPVPSEEELKRRAEVRREQGLRLKEMAAKKREEKRRLQEEELLHLEHLVTLKVDDYQGFQDGLKQKGLASMAELQEAITQLSIRLNKIDPKDFEKPEEQSFLLLDIPDEQLTPEQIKEKKKQRFIKNSQEGRLRKKQQEEEEKRREDLWIKENPTVYKENLFATRKEVLTRMETRKKLKLELSDRRSRATQRRLQTLADLATEEDKKKEDTFGMNDEDWNAYRDVAKYDSESEDEDQSKLVEIEEKIALVDPAFTPSTGDEAAYRVPTAEDYQLELSVERYRVPEIIFQPSMVGIDQAGLPDVMAYVFSKFSLADQLAMAQRVFITGGNTMYPHFRDRVAVELKAIRPFGTTFNVVQAYDPGLDAWKGANMFASSNQFPTYGITKAEYEEKGGEYLKEHYASNFYFPTPTRGEPDAKRQKVDE
eukprot:GILK01007303.1.p1 GENE.GILK01007303.1~~GILK01007303.1.p1  ORF type:complete len:715 (-),score=150.25 GILK01007303.1:179-2323(-)